MVKERMHGNERKENNKNDGNRYQSGEEDHNGAVLYVCVYYFFPAP